MKNITNTAIIESRAKWGKRIMPFAMAFLIGGLITNGFNLFNSSQDVRPTVVLLTLGFVCAIISSNLINNWVNEPRADQTLTQLLKKFGNDYLLYNYTSPASHALIAPDGVYVIVVKKQDGEIKVNERHISRNFSFKRIFRFFVDEGLGSPISEAEKQSRKLRGLFSKNLSTEDMPDIHSLLLFVNKDVKLTLNDPAIPVLSTKEFKSYLREAGKNRTITSAQRKDLMGILDLK